MAAWRCNVCLTNNIAAFCIACGAGRGTVEPHKAGDKNVVFNAGGVAGAQALAQPRLAPPPVQASAQPQRVPIPHQPVPQPPVKKPVPQQPVPQPPVKKPVPQQPVPVQDPVRPPAGVAPPPIKKPKSIDNQAVNRLVEQNRQLMEQNEQYKRYGLIIGAVVYTVAVVYISRMFGFRAYKFNVGTIDYQKILDNLNGFIQKKDLNRLQKILNQIETNDTNVNADIEKYESELKYTPVYMKLKTLTQTQLNTLLEKFQELTPSQIDEIKNRAKNLEMNEKNEKIERNDIEKVAILAFRKTKKSIRRPRRH